eukprot:g378.t1
MISHSHKLISKMALVSTTFQTESLLSKRRPDLDNMPTGVNAMAQRAIPETAVTVDNVDLTVETNPAGTESRDSVAGQVSRIPDSGTEPRFTLGTPASAESLASLQ